MAATEQDYHKKTESKVVLKPVLLLTNMFGLNTVLYLISVPSHWNTRNQNLHGIFVFLQIKNINC